jgi:hypothetical protein
MSDVQYTAVRNTPLINVRSIAADVLTQFLSTCTPRTKLAILASVKM